MATTARRCVALASLASGAPAFAQGQVEAAAACRRDRSSISPARGPTACTRTGSSARPGPHIGDYTGLPINDEARAIADAYQVSMQNMPERQCILYTSQYIVMGPQNLRIQPELDPISGAVVAGT